MEPTTNRRERTTTWFVRELSIPVLAGLPASPTFHSFIRIWRTAFMPLAIPSRWLVRRNRVSARNKRKGQGQGRAGQGQERQGQERQGQALPLHFSMAEDMIMMRI